MGSVESEKYCLKWNDFTSNLSVAFQEMRRDADFFDLTLLTENSEIRCHKLVLGACSSHFRQIIKRLSSQNIPNPAIYLRGVRHEDIKNLLEFMYLGEVNIAHEDLDSFLAVAQDLCIKGLTQDNSTSQNDTSQHTPSGSGNTSSASKRPKFSKNGVEHQQVKKPKREQIMQPIQPKQEPVTHHEIDMSESVGIENVEADVETYDEYYDEDANMDNTGEDSKGNDDQEELSIEIHEYLNSMSGRTEEGRYRCLICGLTCRDLYNQREHLLTHMVRDDKFKNRLDKFMSSNLIKDPKNSSTTCLICQAPVTCNIRKHFLSKHLREPKSNYVQLPDENF